MWSQLQTIHWRFDVMGAKKTRVNLECKFYSKPDAFESSIALLAWRSCISVDGWWPSIIWQKHSYILQKWLKLSHTIDKIIGISFHCIISNNACNLHLITLDILTIFEMNVSLFSWNISPCSRLVGTWQKKKQMNSKFKGVCRMLNM